METATQQTYLEVLESFPKTFQFLDEKGIESIERLDSLWRKENIILRVKAGGYEYVFKKINGEEKTSELERVRLLVEDYPSLMPKIYLFEVNAYLMEYISGNSFFSLKNNQMVEKIAEAGKSLRGIHQFKQRARKDISDKITASFQRYRTKRAKFFQENELRDEEIDFSAFTNVPDNHSHNDLNAANLLYTKRGIRFIDPSEEGYEDIARDVGRYCASCFFNNYDYFGQDKRGSLDIASAFLSNFDSETLTRAKYYIGESFLSFMGFDTVSTSKSALKTLAANMLTKKGGIVKILEESL